MVYRIGTKVQDGLGLGGVIVDSITNPPECSEWWAFVEWDNGEADWVSHDSLTQEESK